MDDVEQKLEASLSFLEAESRITAPLTAKVRKRPSKLLVLLRRAFFLSIHGVLIAAMLMWAERIPTPHLIYKSRHLVHDATAPDDQPAADKVQTPRVEAVRRGLERFLLGVAVDGWPL